MESSLRSILSNSSLWKRTKWFVVIQTWSWRGKPAASARAGLVAGSKHRALALYFSVRMWYVFLISVCRGESGLGLCVTSVFAKGMRQHRADFLFKNVLGRRIRSKLALCSHIIFASPKSCTDLDLTFLYISILRAYTNFVRKNKMLALGVCFPQPCSSAGRRFEVARLAVLVEAVATHCHARLWKHA